MPATFAALQDRVNGAVMRTLATHDAAPATGAAFPVIFDRAYLEQLGIDATGPVAVCRAADAAVLVRGSALAIGGANYTVQGQQPDGTGITTLVLEEVVA